jgi:hypothetical protein
MMGFVVSIVEEAMGNGGTLQQIGINTPDSTVLGLLLGLVGTATLVGTANTAYKLFARKMTAGDISRWVGHAVVVHCRVVILLFFGLPACVMLVCMVCL